MKNILLTTIAVATLSTIAQGQVVRECFDFGVTSVSPTGNTPSNTELTFTGALTNGDMGSPNISPFTMTSNVGNFAGTATTSTFSSANGGVLTFNGSVGMITSLNQLEAATKQLKDEDCKVVDFSFEQCTVINEGTELFTKIAELQKGGTEVFFGDSKSKEAISFKNFKVVAADPKDEKSKRRYEGNTKAFDANKAGADIFYRDERNQIVSLGTTDTQTVFKNFKVCIDCNKQVPEPSSTLLIGLGGVAMLFRRRR